MTTAFLATTLIATSACGQGSSRFEETGTLMLEINGQSHTLHTYFDTEKSRDNIQVTNLPTMKMIGFRASELGDDGNPAYPRFSANIGPYTGDTADELTFEWFTKDAMFFANSNSRTNGQIGELSYDEATGELSFAFNAPEVVEMIRTGSANNDSNYQPPKDGRIISISGNYKGKVVSSK